LKPRDPLETMCEISPEFGALCSENDSLTATTS
jgi:hypothetical protein